MKTFLFTLLSPELEGITWDELFPWDAIFMCSHCEGTTLEVRGILTAEEVPPHLTSLQQSGRCGDTGAASPGLCGAG